MAIEPSKPLKITSTHGYDVFNRACPSRGVLDHVAGRWGILALVALSEGPLRFSAIRRKVDGVSDKMLSQVVQNLERDGLVIRNEKSTMPPVVEYSVTQTGLSIGLAAAHLLETLMLNMDAIRTSNEEADLGQI